MPEFSEGQWVKIKNGALEGLVGQVIRKPEGHLLIAIRGTLPTQAASVLICETRCEAIAERLKREGGDWLETTPSELN